jgi:hypothetical protein
VLISRCYVLWRVLAASTTSPRRTHTCDLVREIVNLDEGRWKTAGKGGQQIDEYYLREGLKKLLPTEGEYAQSKSRRWRANPKSNAQYGYHELHLGDAFSSYLGKGLPSEAPPGWDDDADHDISNPQPEGANTSPNKGRDPDLADTSDTRAEESNNSDSYSGPDAPFSSDTGSDTPHSSDAGRGIDPGSASDPDPVSDWVSDEKAPPDTDKRQKYQQPTAKEPDVPNESGVLTHKGNGISETFTNLPRGPVGRRRARL